MRSPVQRPVTLSDRLISRPCVGFAMCTQFRPPVIYEQFGEPDLLGARRTGLRVARRMPARCNLLAFLLAFS